MLGELVPIVAILCVIGIPMIGLVVRFALSPLIQDLSRAIRGGARDDLDEVKERLARLERQLEIQGEELQRLSEVESFHRELESGESARG